MRRIWPRQGANPERPPDGYTPARVARAQGHRRPARTPPPDRGRDPERARVADAGSPGDETTGPDSDTTASNALEVAHTSTYEHDDDTLDLRPDAPPLRYLTFPSSYLTFSSSLPSA